MISYNSQYRTRCSLVLRTPGNEAKLSAAHLNIAQFVQAKKGSHICISVTNSENVLHIIFCIISSYFEKHYPHSSQISLHCCWLTICRSHFYQKVLTMHTFISHPSLSTLLDQLPLHTHTVSIMQQGNTLHVYYRAHHNTV